MNNIDHKKQKLGQKKARLQLEENRLKVTERKQRTRNLIELGGLVTKANLDYLPVNTLYGALLSLNEALKENEEIKAVWTTKGNAAFNQEKQDRTAVILKFEEQPDAGTRESIRGLGLMWNKFRSEWYGFVTNLKDLKTTLQNQNCKYELEVIDKPTSNDDNN